MKRQSIIKTILLSLLIFKIYGCKDALEVIPTDFISPDYITDEKSAERLRVGCYDILQKRGVYGRYFYEHFDISNDLIMSNNSSAKGLQFYDYNQTEAALNESWGHYYDGINRCNTFLDAIDNIPMNDPVKKETWKAEILSLRSLLYFNLVQYWGDVPFRIASVKSPTDVNYPPTNKLTIISQIIADLETAEAVLPEMDAVNSKYRSSVFTKSAVQGLLARIYLRISGEPFNVAGSYENALLWANKVVEGAKHKLNPSYTQLFLNLSLDIYDRTYNEIIFEVEFSSSGLGDINAEGGFIGTMGSQYNLGSRAILYGGSNTTRKYYEMFENATGKVNDPSLDTRRDWNICPYYYASQQYSPNVPEFRTVNPTANPYLATDYKRPGGKFYRDKENNVTNQTGSSPINFPVLRYAEILLIIAECEVYIHNEITDAALDALNQVWMRAAPSAPIITRAKFEDVESFKQYLRDERARELFMEGQRRQDLIRWGIFVETMKSIAWPGATDNTAIVRVINAISSRHVLFPYPEREMNYNPGMAGKQNLGW